MIFLIFLIIYELIVVVAFTCFPRIKKDPVYYVLVGAIVLLLFVGIYNRPSFFRDTGAYEIVYKAAEWNDIQSFNLLAKEPKSYMEYGFLLIMLLFKSIGCSFRMFSVSLSVFNLLALYFFTRKISEKMSIEKDEHVTNKTAPKAFITAFFALYLPVYGVFYEFVAIRASLSFTLLAFAAVEVIDRKYIVAVFWAVLAFSVQRMSFFGIIPLFFISSWKGRISENLFVFIWMMSGILLLLGYLRNIFLPVGVTLQNLWNSVMHTRITNGFAEKNNQELKRLLIHLAYWCNGAIFMFKRRETKLYSALTAIYVCMIITSAIVYRYMASYRIVDYLYMYSLPVNYSALLYEKDNRSIKVIIICAVTCMLVLAWGAQFASWI